MKIPTFCIASSLILFALPGCIAQRTVTEGDRTVSREVVIKRPLRDAVRNSR